MKIRLQNFQSHQDTVIELAPAGQLTVITGPTDSGKTALIRGFRWVAYNEPTGDGFIRTGADRAVVTISTDDGTVIQRERTRGGVNRYTLTRPGSLPAKFEGFGSTVPLEIQQALNIASIQIEGLTDEIRPNLSEQLDPPFLGKSIPSTARAKVLGVLAGADAVDAANKSTGTDLYRANREVERLNEELMRNAQDQESLGWVEPFGRNLATLQALHTEALAGESRRSTLTALAARVTHHANESIQVANTKTRLARLPRVVELVAMGAAARDRGIKLTALSDRVESNTSQLTSAAGIQSRLIHVPRAELLVTELTRAVDRATRLRRLATLVADNEAQAVQVRLALSNRTTIEQVRTALAAAVDGADRASGLIALADRLARISAGINENREAAVVAENQLTEARAALADLEAAQTITCPKCGHVFVPEKLKEVA